jgi:hypothetical protein
LLLIHTSLLSRQIAGQKTRLNMSIIKKQSTRN